VRSHHPEATQPEPSHAEVFYYQKQVQAQTPMVVVLDDGERLDGVIEWFDKDAVKLRLTTLQRVLIYKSAIKFIYKTGENAPA
jgi:sRNA-binding regulator protein Hfq